MKTVKSATQPDTSKMTDIIHNDEENNHDDMQDQEELIELKEWRDKIGVPAQQQNETLLLDNELLQQQCRALTLELETYTQEVQKLKDEKKELCEDFELNKRTSQELEQSNCIKSVQDQEQQIFEMQRKREESELEALQYKETIDELTKKNNTLQKEVEQYETIVDKLQKEEIALKDKVHKQTTLLNEIQEEYSELEEEFNTQQFVGSRQLEMAQGLKSELSYINKQHNTALEAINSKEEMELGAGKTLHINPQTLRLNSDSYDNDYPTLGWDPDELASDNNDTQRTRRNSTLIEGIYNQIKEQLQSEFDDKMEKHKLKIDSKMSVLTEQIIKYKKQLMLKDNELKQLRNNPLEEGNERHRHRHKAFRWVYGGACCSGSSSIQ